MKRLGLLTLLLVVLSCSGNDDNNENCNFLLNAAVNAELNLSFPQYNDLNFPSSPIYEPNQGNGGIIVTNTGSGYVAYDAADPNHQQNLCSVLTINGLEGECGCTDENTYSLFTGQPLSNPNLPCGLKAYRAELIGNILRVTN
ncbi:MAG: hypothetical protein HKO67_02670 [Flavobacteriaceae bacterium]|nr:hypothetical protein [Flavobacteriaceae bacterium]NNL79370.1 hypothetical protein [Flavobacteriaceae bacterium]